MWVTAGYVRFLRGTAWYKECRKHSEACNLPFGVGASISLALITLAIIARAMIV